eukprot:1284784-Amphidinium_carterae.1
MTLSSRGVHMATHMAIGFLFMGGGRVSFCQEPMAIACLVMACFPLFPTSLTDNRCHLQAIKSCTHVHKLITNQQTIDGFHESVACPQAFRHLYVLAARPHCVEAIEIGGYRAVDVEVLLESSRGVTEVLSTACCCTTSRQTEAVW